MDIVVATGIDGDSFEPEDDIDRAEGYPAEAIEFFVAVEFANLLVDDRVEITVGIRLGLERLHPSVAAMDQGWMATQIELRAPDIQNRVVTYEIDVYINGSPAGGNDLDAGASQEAPAANADA